MPKQLENHPIALQPIEEFVAGQPIRIGPKLAKQHEDQLIQHMINGGYKMVREFVSDKWKPYNKIVSTKIGEQTFFFLALFKTNN